MKLTGLAMWPGSKGPQQGAATSVLAATSPRYAERGGVYLSDCHGLKPHPLALDPEVRASLWARSEAPTGPAP